MNIRPATLDDIPTLLIFEQGVIEAELPMDPTLRTQDVKYYDLQELITAEHIQLLVAENQDKLVGSGYAKIRQAKPYLKHSQYAYLGFMYVEPSHRGQGINGLLIHELKKWCRSKNITELRLEVYEDNPSAIRSYEKVGMKKHMIEMRVDISHTGK